MVNSAVANAFIDSIKNLRFGLVLMFGVAALISKTVVKDALVPAQMDWLADAGLLAALVALLIPLPADVHKQRLYWLVAVAIICLTVMLVIRATLFEEQGDMRLLVGTTLSATGQAMASNCQTKDPSALPHWPRRDLVFKCFGQDDIPTAYGMSYSVMAVVYALSYLCFILVFVIASGRAIERR